MRQTAMVASSARIAGSDHWQRLVKSPTGAGSVARPNGSFNEGDTPIKITVNAATRKIFLTRDYEVSPFYADLRLQKPLRIPNRD